MSQNEPAFHLGTRNHLLVTRSLLACGTIEPCPGRLSDLLRGFAKPSLPLRDAELVSLAGGATVKVDLLHVYLNSVILAHEYVALGGDEHQRALWDDMQRLHVQIVLGAIPGLTMRGHIATDALERDERFLAVMRPTVGGGPAEAHPLLDLVEDLPYLLVNRTAIDSVMVLGPSEAPPPEDSARSDS